MMTEIIIGTVVIAVSIIMVVFFPFILLVLLGVICFGLVAYMIGSAFREITPGYRGL